MEYRRLGNTGLLISRIVLGTVELGMDYGFRNSQHYRRPEAQEAIRTIHRALELGVNLIDTAPSYGSSEEVIGKALQEIQSQRPLIASKVVIPEALLGGEEAKRLRSEILQSIEASLAALRAETIDLMQIHNASAAVLANEAALRALEDAQMQGKVRFLGASCVGEPALLASLEGGWFSALQTPFNILNREIVPRIMPRAAQQGAGILARSAFLRGVLTSNVEATPGPLSELKEAALAVWREFRDEAGSLSELALRFCLSFDAVPAVIIGVRSVAELESNVADAAAGRLLPDQVERLCRIPPPDSLLARSAKLDGTHLKSAGAPSPNGQL